MKHSKMTTAPGGPFADVRFEVTGEGFEMNVFRTGDTWGGIRSILGGFAQSLADGAAFKHFHVEVSGPGHGISVSRRNGDSEMVRDILFGILGILPASAAKPSSLPAPAPVGLAIGAPTVPVAEAQVVDSPATTDAKRDDLAGIILQVAAEQSQIPATPEIPAKEEAGAGQPPGKLPARSSRDRVAHMRGLIAQAQAEAAAAPPAAASPGRCPDCNEPMIFNRRGRAYCKPCYGAKRKPKQSSITVVAPAAPLPASAPLVVAIVEETEQPAPLPRTPFRAERLPTASARQERRNNKPLRVLAEPATVDQSPAPAAEVVHVTESPSVNTPAQVDQLPAAAPALIQSPIVPAAAHAVEVVSNDQLPPLRMKRDRTPAPQFPERKEVTISPRPPAVEPWTNVRFQNAVSSGLGREWAPHLGLMVIVKTSCGYEACKATEFTYRGKAIATLERGRDGWVGWIDAQPYDRYQVEDWAHGI